MNDLAARQLDPRNIKRSRQFKFHNGFGFRYLAINHIQIVRKKGVTVRRRIDTTRKIDGIQKFHQRPFAGDFAPDAILGGQNQSRYGAQNIGQNQLGPW